MNQKEFLKNFPSLKGKIERLWHNYTETEMVDEENSQFKDAGKPNYFDQDVIDKHCFDKVLIAALLDPTGLKEMFQTHTTYADLKELKPNDADEFIEVATNAIGIFCSTMKKELRLE